MRESTGEFEAICFDLDDTLYEYADYARAGLDAAAAYLEERTGEDLQDELRSLYFDDGVTDGTFDILIERHGLADLDVDDLVECYHSATTSLDPYVETEPVLSRLSEEYKLGLVTDGRGGYEKLERLGLQPYFDGVVVTPTLGVSKHVREPFDRITSELSVDSSETMYVGDDPRVDFRIPNELGMTTIRLRRGRYADLEAEEVNAADLEAEEVNSAADEQIDSLIALLTKSGCASFPD